MADSYQRGKARRAQTTFMKNRLCLAISAALFSPWAAWAAPQGGVVTSGSASIGQAGSVTTIDQSSQKAAINWQGFSVAPTESVNFNQPNASAITLNRVLGNEKSVIEGALNANGQVFLVNSNGVLFGKNSQVNVGGLVASTLDISDQDFQAGHYRFQGEGEGGAVINLGAITVTDGGYAALLGQEVSNRGVIVATRGTVALSSGERISLNFNGDSLVSVAIEQGALDALVENRQAIYADGGQVILTARAADELLSAQVNNDGLIQARSIDDLTGSIELYAHGGTATIDGTLDASAPDGGDGGFIETSGDVVDIADDAFVTTRSASGQTGTWLIDPNDFTVAASGGNMTGAAVASALAQNNFEIQTATMGSAGGNGDIHVNDAITWSSDNTLTLSAERDIDINADITAEGASAGLVLNYGGDYHILTSASYAGAVLDEDGQPVANQAPPEGTRYASITFSDSANKDGLSINGQQYQLIHDLDELATTGTASGYYALAGNLDATQWSADNASGSNAASVIAILSGTLAGLGHSISNLTLNKAANWVGLVGQAANGTTIRDIGLVDVDISGSQRVGALVGQTQNNSEVSIINSYATGQLGAVSTGGGLVGASGNKSALNIVSSYADVDITSTGTNLGGQLGGLLGGANGAVTIERSHATGDVESTALSAVTGFGGLVGSVSDKGAGSITFSYATGKVIGPQRVGGLVGYAEGTSANPITVTDSFATGDVESTANDPEYVGGLIGYAEYVNLDNVHASGNVTALGAGGTLGSRYIGGLLGRLVNGSLNNAHATGNVTVGTVNSSIYGSIGGLVGHLSGSTVSNSYATGDVVAESGRDMGGLVGGMGNDSHIIDSWASGNVTGVGLGGGGGLVGAATGTIENSHAYGDVTGILRLDASGNPIDNFMGGLVGNTLGRTTITGSSASGAVSGFGFVGGLVGRASSLDSVNIIDSYWNSDSTGQSNAVGRLTESTNISNSYGLTDEQFEDAEFYLDGSIDQVLADRAAEAAAQAEAAARLAAARTAAQTASQVAAQAQADARQQARQAPALAETASLARPPAAVDANTVFAETSDFSADIQRIEVDGVIYELEESDEE